MFSKWIGLPSGNEVITPKAAEMLGFRGKFLVFYTQPRCGTVGEAAPALASTWYGAVGSASLSCGLSIYNRQGEQYKPNTNKARVFYSRNLTRLYLFEYRVHQKAHCS